MKDSGIRAATQSAPQTTEHGMSIVAVLTNGGEAGQTDAAVTQFNRNIHGEIIQRTDFANDGQYRRDSNYGSIPIPPTPMLTAPAPPNMTPLVMRLPSPMPRNT